VTVCRDANVVHDTTAKSSLRVRRIVRFGLDLLEGCSEDCITKGFISSLSSEVPGETHNSDSRLLFRGPN
jgi:hypothetical protein